MTDEIYIETLSSEDEHRVVALIKRNLSTFDQTETVLAATFRRLQDLVGIYGERGCKFYVAKNRADRDEPIACVGLGPLHGLPSSEGVGEIRDLVVEERFRGRGLGSRLLHLCIADAKKLGYGRLYLETSKNMTIAQHLFVRTGFRPVVDRTVVQDATESKDLPSYYLLEEL